MKKLLTFVCSLLMASAMIAAPTPDEGMWLPIFVKDLNIQQMQAMGLHLSAEDIYSINQNSMKDAIVNFGNFCTAEVVSKEGLLFTNHHCGYDAIQKHSSVDHDYLTDGFWSYSYGEEIPCEGLTATFFIRMEDVTERVLSKVNDKMTETERAEAVKKECEIIQNENNDNGKLKAVVEDLFAGNEYYLFIYKVYTDVRLVGAPPSSIGKFGGDTDNWMWPRHTGDFSIFRVYADKNNEPAAYSKDNVPFKPSYVLPVSVKGYEKNDFAMIWGYPGSTERYMSSYGVEHTLNQVNPAIDGIFDVVLSNMKKGMNKSQAVNIMYASDYASYANLWKNKKGETRGLKNLKVYDKKLALENELTRWMNQNPDKKQKYGEMLVLFRQGYDDLDAGKVDALQWNIQGGLIGSKILLNSYKNGNAINEALSTKKQDKEGYAAVMQQMKTLVEEQYKEYDQYTEELIFREVLRYFHDNVKEIEAMKIVDKKFKGNVDAYVDYLLAKSNFATKEKYTAFLENPKAKTLEKDPIFDLSTNILNTFIGVYPIAGAANEKLSKAQRLYEAAIREMNSDKAYYPDANFTMRMTYGSVLDYYPADAVHYDYTTTINGVMEKEDPTNPEFVVPEKLKQLYRTKNYGRYTDKNGDMTVCFLTNNDITGGNSGSPVINGDGQLIGIAFDGNWEAMSGDIAFEPDLQRCINVDIRYVLFIIDKYANCQRLINELTIVE